MLTEEPTNSSFARSPKPNSNAQITAFRPKPSLSSARPQTRPSRGNPNGQLSKLGGSSNSRKALQFSLGMILCSGIT